MKKQIIPEISNVLNDNICFRIAEKFLDKLEKLNPEERQAIGKMLSFSANPLIIANFHKEE